MQSVDKRVTRLHIGDPATAHCNNSLVTFNTMPWGITRAHTHTPQLSTFSKILTTQKYVYNIRHTSVIKEMWRRGRERDREMEGERESGRERHSPSFLSPLYTRPWSNTHLARSPVSLTRLALTQMQCFYLDHGQKCKVLESFLNSYSL